MRPDLASQLGVPNWRPELASRIGVPNWRPELASRIEGLQRVPNELFIKVQSGGVFRCTQCAHWGVFQRVPNWGSKIGGIAVRPVMASVGARSMLSHPEIGGTAKNGEKW